MLLFPLTLLAESDVEQFIRQTGVKEGPVAVRDFPMWREPRKIVVRAADEFAEDVLTRAR